MAHTLVLNEEARAFYRENPVAFVEDQIINGRTNIDGSVVVVDSAQREILDNYAKGLWPIVPAGRGVGKTCAIAWVVLWWIYCHPTAKCIVNSVKKEQLADNLWPEIKRWLLGATIVNDVQWEKTKVYVKGREEQNFAVARTGADMEALQGYHDDFLLIIIEEASALDSESFDALLGSLTSTGGHNAISMFGNPRRLSGPFAALVQKPSGRFKVTHIPCIDLNGNIHPRVAPEQIEQMRNRYGERSNQYRVHVLGLLPEADDNALIPWEWVMGAAQHAKTPEPDTTYRIVWGVDIATLGTNQSALVKRQGPLVLEPPIRRQGLNTMQNADWILDEYARTPKPSRPHRIYIDRIGVGAGVADRLAELGLPAEGIAVSRVAANKTRFFRLRDELWWRTRLWFESGFAYIPDDEDFIKELTSLHYSLATGKVKVESKDELREREPRIGSPDSADALVLTFMDQDDLRAIDDFDEDDGWSRRGPRWSNATWVSM